MLIGGTEQLPWNQPRGPLRLLFDIFGERLRFRRGEGCDRLLLINRLAPIVWQAR